MSKIFKVFQKISVISKGKVCLRTDLARENNSLSAFMLLILTVHLAFVSSNSQTAPSSPSLRIIWIILNTFSVAPQLKLIVHGSLIFAVGFYSLQYQLSEVPQLPFHHGPNMHQLILILSSANLKIPFKAGLCQTLELPRNFFSRGVSRVFSPDPIGSRTYSILKHISYGGHLVQYSVLQV